MKYAIAAVFVATISLLGTTAQATLVNLGTCTGAVNCIITTTPPNPIAPDPNDGVLLAWNEVQNLTLIKDLRVNRVFDDTASFVRLDGNDIYLRAGTVISSHYLQWDPGNDSAARVQTTISADSQIFAFITDTALLANTDATLGLPGLDYADFGLRGLETGDATLFSGANVAIDWSAGSPGDWTRLITAFSPQAAVPLPASAYMLIAAFGMLAAGARLGRRAPLRLTARQSTYPQSAASGG